MKSPKRFDGITIRTLPLMAQAGADEEEADFRNDGHASLAYRRKVSGPL